MKLNDCAQKFRASKSNTHLIKQEKLYLLQQKKRALQNRQIYTYSPHSKQKIFHENKAKERAFIAGNRCGKTYAGAMEMAMHLTGIYPKWWQGKRFNEPIKAWAASVTTEATRDILQRNYIGDFEQDTSGTIPQNKIEKIVMKRGVSGAVDTLYVRHSSGGISQLGFKSYDQGREKFQGTSRDVIHLDEEPDLRLYEECLMRTMDVSGILLLTMTPLKGMSDVCLHFLEQTTDDKFYIQASWDDANHLSNAEKNTLRKTLRPHEIEAREKGIPTLGSGRVFPIKESEILVKRFPIPSHYKRVLGIDFGWTNPTAVVWLAYDAEADIVYVTDVYARSELTPEQHVKNIQQKGAWIPAVADPAGQGSSQADGVSLMSRYAEHGMYLTPAENHVDSGLMHILERMQSGKFKVFDDLDNWWKEFRVYRRNESGKIVKKNDHLMDATRYAVVSGIPLSKVKNSHENMFRRKRSDWRTV